MTTGTSAPDYAARMEFLYGNASHAEQPSAFGAAPADEPTDSQRRSGQRQSKKYAAHEKFQLAHNFTVAGARQVSSTAGKVWYVLWNWSRDGVISMSHVQIAEQIGMGEKTAERATKELEDRGFVTVLIRGGKKLGPSTYQLHSVSALHDKSVAEEQTNM